MIIIVDYNPVFSHFLRDNFILDPLFATKWQYILAHGSALGQLIKKSRYAL